MDPSSIPAQPNYQAPAGQPLPPPAPVYSPATSINPSLPPQPGQQVGLPPAAHGTAPPVGGLPAAKANPNSTQNALQVAEVRDGIVIMSDGSFRSVIMAKSINFDLMSPQEREAVEYAYQGFLNSLYFPIQIFIRSQKVDLTPYIEKLDKIRSEHENMLLALLMEDYVDYIENLSLQTNIMDKKFYIVVPYIPVADLKATVAASKSFLSGVTSVFKNKEQHVVINEQDLDTAKNELRNRVQAVLAGLLQCGIQGLPLDTQELIELYYDTYNPDTSTRQQLKNFDDLSAPVITKGPGTAPQPNLERELQ